MTAPLVRRSPAHRARVTKAEMITPRMRRVTVACEAMTRVTIRPAQDVELLLREPTGRRVKRRYTIRHHRPGTGELDLEVVLHGDGPGARWGMAAQPGDEVEFQGPRGKLELRPAAHHLLAGDESALPAIAAILAALPADEPATAFVEVNDADDETGAGVEWVYRNGGPPGQPELLATALRACDIGTGTRAYLMGETRAMVALRALLEDRGVEHDAIFVKGYWNLGRPDRLAGRAPR